MAFGHRHGAPFLQGLPGPWSPALLAGNLLWLQLDSADLFVDAARTVPSASGDPVGGWRDRSAALHHCAQFVSSRRPIYYDSGLGGGARPRVRFDEADDTLPFGSWIPPGACTLAVEFSRWKPLAGVSGRMVHLSDGGATRASLVALVDAPGYQELSWCLGWPLVPTAGVGVASALGTARHTLVVAYDGVDPSAPSSYQCRLDGIDSPVVTTGAFVAFAFGGLGGETDAQRSPPMDLGRVAIWGADHWGSRAQIEEWLNA